MTDKKNFDGVRYVLDQVASDILGYDRFTDDNLERLYAMAHGVFDKYAQEPMAHLTGTINTIYAIPDLLTNKKRNLQDDISYSSGGYGNTMKNKYQEFKDSAKFWYNLGYDNYNSEANRLQKSRPYAYEAGKTLISTPYALRKVSPVQLGHNIANEVLRGKEKQENWLELLQRAGWGAADTFFPGVKNWGRQWLKEN